MNKYNNNNRRKLKNPFDPQWLWNRTSVTEVSSVALPINNDNDDKEKTEKGHFGLV